MDRAQPRAERVVVGARRVRRAAELGVPLEAREARKQVERVERKVLLEPPILHTGATWASGLRHASSGALLQGQAPAVRMDYKQDTHLWQRKSDDRCYSNSEICRTKDL